VTTPSPSNTIRVHRSRKHTAKQTPNQSRHSLFAAVFDYYCAHAATGLLGDFRGFRISGFRISDPSCRCCHALITDLNGHCKPNSGCEKYLKHLIISVPVFRIFSTFFNPEIESHDRNAVQSDRFTQGFTLRVSSAHWPVSSQQKICTASSRETDGDAFRSSPARASEASGLRCKRGTLVVLWKLHICNRLI
jgi:hypothetical protein